MSAFWKKHILLNLSLLVVIVFFLFYHITSPCEDGLFIGLCGWATYIGVVTGILFLFNFIFTSTITRFLVYKIDQLKKGWIIIFFYILSLGLSFILIYFEVYTYMQISGYRSRVKSEAQYRKRAANYSISNFKDRFGGTYGKYRGLFAEFDLRINEEGYYNGSLEVKYNHLKRSYETEGRVLLREVNSGSRTFRNLYFNKGEIKHINFILVPTEYFEVVKLDGPYYFTLTIWPSNGGVKEWMHIVGNREQFDKATWRNEHIFDDDLVSHTYQFEDFLLNN